MFNLERWTNQSWTAHSPAGDGLGCPSSDGEYRDRDVQSPLRLLRGDHGHKDEPDRQDEARRNCRRISGHDRAFDGIGVGGAQDRRTNATRSGARSDRMLSSDLAPRELPAAPSRHPSRRRSRLAFRRQRNGALRGRPKAKAIAREMQGFRAWGVRWRQRLGGTSEHESEDGLGRLLASPALVAAGECFASP